MLNMDYKTQAIRIIGLYTLLLYSNIVTAQDCIIEKVPIKAFYFNQSGLINSKYENMKKTDSNNYQIMLINFLGYSNEKQCFYLSIDPNKKFNFETLTEDSIQLSGCINTTRKYNSEILSNRNDLNGFLVSECRSVLSSHTKQGLIICNNSLNIWIEYISMDGHMKESLNTNKNFLYLNEIYKLIEKVFKDLQVSIELK